MPYPSQQHQEIQDEIKKLRGGTRSNKKGFARIVRFPEKMLSRFLGLPKPRFWALFVLSMLLGVAIHTLLSLNLELKWYWAYGITAAFISSIFWTEGQKSTGDPIDKLDDFIQILVDKAEAIAIFLAAVFFLLEAPDRRTQQNLQDAEIVVENKATPTQRRESLERLVKHKANLTGIDLTGANLREAKLSIAKLSSANLYRANLREADLRIANLREADLRIANLREANLHSASLSITDLSGTDLSGTNLYFVDLESAILLATDLRNAHKLTQQQFKGDNPPLLCNSPLPLDIEIDPNIDPNRDCDKLPKILQKRYPNQFLTLEAAQTYVRKAREKTFD